MPDGAGMAKSCSMWLPTGSLCQSILVPSQYLKQDRLSPSSNYRLVSWATTSPQTADVFSSACLWGKALPYPSQLC